MQKMAKKVLTDEEIENLYDNTTVRFTQEKNDFLVSLLPKLVEEEQWINLRPEYQRRLVWDQKKKSKFIESLIMNIPIPQLFLFEYDLNRYEVMDGQQRLNTILDFYNDKFKLKGLEFWSDLNNKTYSKLPNRIQRGLDRRKISSIIMLAESAKSKEDKIKLREFIFERLNTGGVRLNAQELRNCLYTGIFNNLIIDLAGNNLFNDILKIPRYSENIKNNVISAQLSENIFFKRMKDCEIVLRFFALRKRSKIKSSIKTILDNTMMENRYIDEDETQELKNIFISRLELSFSVFGEKTFRLNNNDFSVGLYDVVMVVFDKLFLEKSKIEEKSTDIKNELYSKLESDDDFKDLITGRKNTAVAIKKRHDAFEQLVNEIISL